MFVIYIRNFTAFSFNCYFVIPILPSFLKIIPLEVTISNLLTPSPSSVSQNRCETEKLCLYRSQKDVEWTEKSRRYCGMDSGEINNVFVLWKLLNSRLLFHAKRFASVGHISGTGPAQSYRANWWPYIRFRRRSFQSTLFMQTANAAAE